MGWQNGRGAFWSTSAIFSSQRAATRFLYSTQSCLRKHLGLQAMIGTAEIRRSISSVWSSVCLVIIMAARKVGQGSWIY
ncbi:hypothetical protein IU11_03920 [Cellulosimicrobium sp. MM]|nr:hypothetical protein IU11_03920 [Cellulosimicrobium sp. MM]